LFFIAGVLAEKSVSGWGLKFTYLKSLIITFFVWVIGALTYLSNQQSRVWKNDLTLFTHAMNVQPLSHIAYTKVGVYHNVAGRIDEAMQYYEKALALSSKNFIVLNNIGQCYVDKKQYALSIPYFQKAIYLKSNDPDTWYNMGNAYHSLGNFEEAVRDYTIALENNKYHFNAYNNRASAFFAMGEWEKGLQDMRMAAQGGNANAIQSLMVLEGGAEVGY
jgi:tetratricopeptide (TPR) repeat protein